MYILIIVTSTVFMPYFVLITVMICAAAVVMPSVQGDDDDGISDCSDSSTASSFEDEAEEGPSEIDAEYDVINGSVSCDKLA